MTKRPFIITAVLLAGLVVLGIVTLAPVIPRFPYGQSHCCIIGMASALEQYAEAHGGRYPAGGASPEASLSLLYRSNLVDANAIRGMTVSEANVRDILENGRALGPQSCGWHYVEGLTRADDDRLALLYCKEGLGHNGQLTDGGRQVVFVGGNIEWVSGERWAEFVTEQHQLFARRSYAAKNAMPLIVATIVLPDGSEIERVDGPYTLAEERNGPFSSSTGTTSASGLSRSSLCWYKAPLEEGRISLTLSFSDLVSKPVTINFKNGTPDQTSVVFRMQVPAVTPVPTSPPMAARAADRHDDGSNAPKP